MLHNIATVLAVDLVREEESEDAARSTFAAQMRANRGQVVKAFDDIILVKFPNALAAVTCAAQAQRARFAASGSLRPIRFAVNHFDDGTRDGELRPEDVNDIVNLLDLAEAGGISLGRTVYDIVRHDLKLPYDTQVEAKYWHYACVPFRLNSNKINIVKDSAVRVSASAFANDQRLDSAYKAGPLRRALSSCAFLFHRNH
jgi:hypothetical protein